MNGKKLYKSRYNRKLCGVCGGVGEYFGIDPTVVRIIWAIVACCAGAGVLIYLVFALAMSEVPDGFSVVETDSFAKKLYKSRDDRKICGVCGGIAEYLGIDPMIIRVIWAVAALFFGTGILAYLVCAIVVPESEY